MSGTTTTKAKALVEGEGLKLLSGPGRDLVFKVTGDETDGAFDFFTVEVAPLSGPPLHVHHTQEEAIFVLKGRYKVKVGEDIFHCDPGGFVYMPKQVPHAFFNLTDEVGQIIVVYTPGGGQKFYEEFGPVARSGADRGTIAAVFAKHDMTLLGPPLTPD